MALAVLIFSEGFGLELESFIYGGPSITRKKSKILYFLVKMRSIIGMKKIHIFSEEIGKLNVSSNAFVTCFHEFPIYKNFSRFFSYFLLKQGLRSKNVSITIYFHKKDTLQHL